MKRLRLTPLGSMITIVPDGMPSNPTAYAQVDPPSGYSG